GDDASADDDAPGPSGPTFGGDSGLPTGMTLADAGCATAMAQAKRKPVYLEFVLDGSNSMSSQNKWAAAVPALKSIFGEMQTAADPGVAAGLIIFPNTTGTYPGTDDVPIAFVSSAQNTALATRLGTQLRLGTPTQGALTGGYTALEDFTPASPLLPDGRKVVVLITDGVPTDG